MVQYQIFKSSAYRTGYHGYV